MNILDYIVLFLLIGLGMLAASCTTEDELCTKGKAIDGTTCIEIFQPVIAPDGTEYPNSCYAERDGWDNSCLKLKPIYD